MLDGAEMVGQKLPALGHIESDPINLPSSHPTTKSGKSIKPVSEVEELCTQERQGWKGWVFHKAFSSDQISS